MDGVEELVLTEAVSRLFIVSQIVALLLVALIVVIGEWTALFGRTRGRRAFRCALAGRDVEVQVTERRVFGFGQPLAVHTCSAFESPTAVACRRQCLDGAFRRQWEFALPVGRLAQSSPRP
jgi:hypothetical protein